jgi:hypothetical protein
MQIPRSRYHLSFQTAALQFNLTQVSDRFQFLQSLLADRLTTQTSGIISSNSDVSEGRRISYDILPPHHLVYLVEILGFGAAETRADRLRARKSDNPGAWQEIIVRPRLLFVIPACPWRESRKFVQPGFPPKARGLTNRV